MKERSNTERQTTPAMLWQTLSIFTLVVVCVAILVTIGSSEGGSDLVWVILAAPVSYLVALAVHTAGHLVAGYLAGFELISFAIWPVRLVPVRRGWLIRRNPEPADSGAYKSTPKYPQHLWTRALIVNASGPLANIALALTWAFLLCLDAFDSPVKWCLWIALCSSLVVAINTLVPVGTVEGQTDGWKIGYLLRHRDEALRQYAAEHLLLQAARGYRPRDWEPRWIELALGPRDGLDQEVIACQLAYYWAWDRGGVEQASEYVGRLLAAAGQDVAPASRHAAYLTAAFYDAAFTKEVDRAKRRLADAAALLSQIPAMPIIGLPPAIEQLRAEAAVLFATGEMEPANARAREWLARQDPRGTTLPGLRQVEREWIETTMLADSEQPEVTDENSEAGDASGQHG